MRLRLRRKMSLQSDSIRSCFREIVKQPGDGGIASIGSDQKLAFDRFISCRDPPAGTLTDLDDRLSELYFRTARNCIFQKSVIQKSPANPQFASSLNRQIESNAPPGRRPEVDPA